MPSGRHCRDAAHKGHPSLPPGKEPAADEALASELLNSPRVWAMEIIDELEPTRRGIYTGSIGYREGFRAIVSSIRRNSQSPASRVKSTSYLESVLAKEEARAAGADEAVRLNERGFVTEASMSNIFLVAGGTLRTPALASGILPSFTRQAVLELASGMDITSSECDIESEEPLRAQEAFVTSSLVEVMPLTRVGNEPIGSNKPGAITSRLMAAYKELVAIEMGAV